MLEIKKLFVRVEDKEILKGIDLTVKKGEVHAIMGPNGSGKSTLAGAIAGRDTYEITSGEIVYEGKDLLELSPEERAREGIFLAFQYPVEIPGVSNLYFLKHRGERRTQAPGRAGARRRGFHDLCQGQDGGAGHGRRHGLAPVNMGFSGGEKKRNEIFQMSMLEPKLAVLDETDSGLDIDALKTVADGVNAMRSPERAIIVVTHYQRLLDYIIPDYVHVLAGGRVVKSGGKELALELEEKGYGWLQEEPNLVVEKLRS
jgi:Fe-S cluster assembly ATP-binding protein